MTKTVHSLSNWILTSKLGHMVLIGDCYTRFPKANGPLICTGTIAAIVFDHEKNDLTAETKNSIYKLSKPNSEYEKQLNAIGLPIYALCFDHRTPN